MPQDANALDTKQMCADGSNAPTKIQSPQTTLHTDLPNETTDAIIDAAVFAGTTHAAPVQAGDGTTPLSFVPIGGTFIDSAVAPQTKPASLSVTNEDGKNHAPLPLTLSLVLPRSEKSASPSPIPIPLRPQPDNQSRANSVHSGLLTSPDPDRERYSTENLSTLWRGVKALKRYHAAHNRQYPGGFSLPGLAKTAPMIQRLAKLPKPPLTSDEFMTDFDVQYRLDVMLARGIKAVLPQITEYLGMDDSRDVPKEPTHDTRNVVKEPSDDNRDINKELVDNS